MTFTQRFVLALFVMVAVAYVADAQDVHYNYDRSANFQSYKTYSWVDVPSSASKIEPPAGAPPLPSGLPKLPGGASEVQGVATEDQLLDAEVKRAIDEQLAQKGLTKVEKGGDLQVAYHAVLREEKAVNLSGFGWRNYGWADASVNGQSSTIPIGTLVVDLYDSAHKQLIWRGDATKTLDGIKKDPNKNYKQLEKAMAKLFKNYPPQAGK
jgi:hypothetical protein